MRDRVCNGACLVPPLSCSLVIVKRRHAGWHGAEGSQECLGVVSVPELRLWAAPLDRRGVGGMSRVI